MLDEEGKNVAINITTENSTILMVLFIQKCITIIQKGIKKKLFRNFEYSMKLESFKRGLLLESFSKYP